MYTCVAYQTNILSMIITALGRKVPGSYARKQINVITYLLVLLYPVMIFASHKFEAFFSVSLDELLELSRYVLVICLVFRFIMHIHAMRLFPGIGHFVITTFIMGSNLLHFSIVFGMVLFIFSVLFNILNDEPKCPIIKMEGFDSLLDSMFSTFKLTFGHGDLDPYFTGPPAKMTYTLYVIIVGLLLMNLIIAIMSTTATEIMADPWKGALWWVEWLDEATSVEYTFSVIGLCCRSCSNCNYRSHKRAGFVVRRIHGKTKVFIEVFRCPALE